jgi:hypothetical protein
MVDHETLSLDSGAERRYLPAMGRRWLLPLYDPLTRLAGLPRIHRELVEQADLRAGLRVLEIGCGPGGLLHLVHLRFPDADLAGLDPDPAALARARRKLGPGCAWTGVSPMRCPTRMPPWTGSCPPSCGTTSTPPTGREPYKRSSASCDPEDSCTSSTSREPERSTGCWPGGYTGVHTRPATSTVVPTTSSRTCDRPA